MTRIGLVGIGDMGGGVGRSFVAAGHEVSSVLAGRSEESVGRAEAGGITDSGDMASLVRSSDVVLSIVPPGIASDVAEEVAGHVEALDDKPLFADLNAIAPETTRKIGDRIEAAGGTFVDGSIIGLAPYKTPNRTRLYLSGPSAPELGFLSTDEIDVRNCGPEIGQASGIKMVYAALSKGTMTLHTAVALAAYRMGLTEVWMQEMSESQADKLAAMRGSVPFIAADSVRWADEMDEIAASFAAVGVTPKFHEGAGEIFRLLASTSLEAETRATMDRSRTLEDALEIYASHIPGPG